MRTTKVNWERSDPKSRVLQESMQRTRRSLPVWREKRLEDLAPATEEERTWIANNIGLGIHMAQKLLPEMDTAELSSFVFVPMLHGYRLFDPSVGVKLSTYVATCVAREITSNGRRMHFIHRVGKGGIVRGGPRYSALLLGGRSQVGPEEVERPEPDLSEVLDRIRNGWGEIKPRNRTIVALYLGIDCERVPVESIARRFGISRERVYQVYYDSLRRIARNAGLPEGAIRSTPTSKNQQAS